MLRALIGAACACVIGLTAHYAYGRYLDRAEAQREAVAVSDCLSWGADKGILAACVARHDSIAQKRAENERAALARIDDQRDFREKNREALSSSAL